jgi:hypothetical protein
VWSNAPSEIAHPKGCAITRTVIADTRSSSDDQRQLHRVPGHSTLDLRSYQVR